MNKRTRGAAMIAAVAVCASPLLASAAFAAPLDDVPTTWSRLVLHDTTDPAAGGYVAVDDELHGTREPNLDAAEDEAGSQFFDLPIAGHTGQILSLESGEYVAPDDGAPTGVGYTGTDYLPGKDWDISSTGEVKASNGKYLGFDDRTGELALTDTPRYVVTGSSTGLNPVSLVVGLDSIDQEAGTAVISGSASSSARYDAVVKVVGGNWQSTSANGTWVGSVSGLKPGSNAVTVEQEIDGVTYDSKTIDIVLGADSGGDQRQPLIVDGPTDEFDTGLVNFTGHATPGARITFKPTYPDLAAVETDANDKGEWQIDFGMGYGPYTVKITQDALGSSDSKQLDLLPKGWAQDKPFTLTSPVKGGEFDTGGVTWTGEGAGKAGSTVTLHSTYPTGIPDVTVPVNKDGSWSLLTGMGYGPYVFDLIQKDANGTPTDTITDIDLLPKGWNAS